MTSARGMRIVHLLPGLSTRASRSDALPLFPDSRMARWVRATRERPCLLVLHQAVTTNHRDETWHSRRKAEAATGHSMAALPTTATGSGGGSALRFCSQRVDRGSGSLGATTRDTSQSTSQSRICQRRKRTSALSSRFTGARHVLYFSLRKQTGVVRAWLRSRRGVICVTPWRGCTIKASKAL